LNVVFFGTPDFAVVSLDALRRGGHAVSLVVTQPDQPAGRGRKLSEPAVKRYATLHGLPVIQPRKMRDETFLARLRSEKADLFVVAAYGRILPAGVLSIPPVILNVHASILPRWRGAAPIERAILAGDEGTGISIMRIVPELDAGDLLLVRPTPIGGEETGGELTDRLALLGGEALLEGLELLARGEGVFVPQDPARVTFAPPLIPAEARIDWSAPAREIHDRVRAFHPRPGAFTSDDRQKIKLFRTRRTGERADGKLPGALCVGKGELRVATGDEWLSVLEVQREGKSRQEIGSFLPGYPVASGARWT
jgi:methionyl-tRNA formyltransferase